MKTDLLLKLARKLQSLKPEKFDYQQWSSGLDLKGCGTVACAGGWATTIPDTGLVMGQSYDACAPVFAKDRDLAPIDALARAFELTYEQANQIFYSSGQLPSDPTRYTMSNGKTLLARPRPGASAKEVAAWIRFCVRGWKAGNEIVRVA